MPAFSTLSKNLLDQADHHLRILFEIVVKFRDCTILESYRDEQRQNELFAQGRSQLKWPKSNHNTRPSLAVDVAPYFGNRQPGERISFNKYEVVEFGHYVLGVRDILGLTDKIRWGGDWNRDFMTLTDKEFLDGFHWEVIKE